MYLFVSCSSGRKKRDADADAQVKKTWNNAKCMNSHLDPVLKFGYIPKLGCKLEKD
jgi:hypothetical protein